MKINQKRSLRWQFNLRMLSLLIVILVISGAIQGYILKTKLNEDIRDQASMIGRSVEHGITETDLASKNIEHQIDLKLQLYDLRISDRLKGRSLRDISTADLVQLRDEFDLTGITLIAKKDGDFVNVMSTDPTDVGFGWKAASQDAFDSLAEIYKDAVPPDKGFSYFDKGIFTLYAAQSGSHTDKPEFFKYSYYHLPQTDYIINAYIRASEVYDFTQKVGPESWIEKMLQENKYAKEIAVLDPRVFADPSLETKMYPPLKQVVQGSYHLQSKRDTEILKSMVSKKQTKTIYIDKSSGQSLYKMFLPLDEGRVIYIALDYKQLKAPLYRYSFILIVFGFIALIALFMFTASFFAKIYRNIQQIIIQIKKLEEGDLTAKSNVKGGGELGELSDSANAMADSLHLILTDTQNKAIKAQNLSKSLENQANDSVEKAFTVSMETTSRARETVDDIFEYLDQAEEQLRRFSDHPQAKEVCDKTDRMREIAKERTNQTTDITITLSDLFKSLHGQSSELSELSNSLLQQLAKFKLSAASSADKEVR